MSEEAGTMTGDAVIDGWSIRAQELTKVYRLYRRPAYRFFDLFGLCPAGDRYYTEHAAVDRLDLTIGRGEKVAIIGRNGAGKSTLLKLISGVLRPTAGSIEVRGSIKALLEIGTGFHPEFTGRDNVLASLAYQGVVGAEARRALEEIAELAELEEYIDQPMRTYSTGMMMRLMFSAATCVEPDILVADEVLGVGDAYFAHKSFDRVKRLVESRGTTFLLVTHNFYSALEVCERFVWLDQGRIMLDGTGIAVVGAYEESIKEQEERRQHRAKVREAAATLAGGKLDGLTIRFSARDDYRPGGPFYLLALSGVWPDGRRVACALDVPTTGAAFRALPAESVKTATRGGRPCLLLREYGDIFHKLDCWLSVSAGSQPPHSLEVEYAFEGTGTLVVSVSTDGTAFLEVGPLEPTPPGEWRATAVRIPSLQDHDSQARSRLRTFGRYGTADVTIEDLRLLDDTGEASLLFRHGRAMRIELEYLIRNSPNIGEMVVAAGMHRDGHLPIALFVSPPFTPGTGRGTVTLAIDNIRLTNGEYVLGIALVRPDILRSNIFFSMSPDVFDHRPRAVSFRVVRDDQPQKGWAYVQESKWTVRPRSQ